MPQIDDIWTWLLNAQKRYDALLEIYGFGSSVLGEAHPSDVDIIIVFSEWEARDTCIKLEREFLKRFATPLHIQKFHVSQTEEIVNFIDLQADIRKII
jgi:predicted nucleotidyltransferase